MVDRAGRQKTSRQYIRLIIAVGLAAGILSACAGTNVPSLRPDVPDDLRQPSGPAPDFRQPPPEQQAPSKTPEEQAAAVKELETLRDTAEKDARKKIEGR